MSASPMPDLPRHFSERPIWIDATGVVRWGPQPFTGVQRVEFGVLRHALTQPDAGIAVMDTTSGLYSPASARLLAFIDHIGEAQSDAVPKSRLQRLSRALRFLDLQLWYGDNETARRLANDILGGRTRSGLAYQIVKLGFRAPIWLLSAAGMAAGPLKRLARRLRRKPQKQASRPFLLVAHEVNRHSLIAGALTEAGLRGANIVYDLIPVLAPELTNARFSRTMEGFFRRILTTPEPAIAISRVTRDDLLKWNAEAVKADYPFPVGAIPLTSAHDPAQETREIPALRGRRFALFCSTMDVRKGHDLLVAAWRRLAGTLDDTELPDLALIGRRGPGWPAVEAELRKAPALQDRIHILHGVDDAQLRWAYSRAVLALFPSKAEGWGLGVSEALAFGVPVVHSDIPILREAAQDLMPSAPPGDAEAWAKLLGDLFAHPEKIEALRETVRRDYKPGAPDDFARGVFSYLHALRDNSSAKGVVRPQPPAL